MENSRRVAMHPDRGVVPIRRGTDEHIVLIAFSRAIPSMPYSGATLCRRCFAQVVPQYVGMFLANSRRRA